MSRGNYSMGKRQRDTEKARKKRRKAELRAQKRLSGPGEVPISEQQDVTGDLVAAEREIVAKRAAAVAGARSIPSRLFVGGLSWNTHCCGRRGRVRSRYRQVPRIRIRDHGRSPRCQPCD